MNQGLGVGSYNGVQREKRKTKQIKITANNLHFKMNPQTKQMKKSNAERANNIIISDNEFIPSRSV